MITIKVFVFNPFMENTYILHDESNQALIIDPGCYEKSEKESLKEYILQHDLKVVGLLNTHCHIDHVLGNSFVSSEYNVQLQMHAEDEATLRAVKAYAPNYGFNQYEELLPEKFLAEGDVIQFGESNLKVLFAPGHAPGHIVFYNAQEGFVIGGDVLFRESIGRTDLPGGDMDTLIQSIREKLFTLPNDTVVYPGHGPSTIIAHERSHNPFCADK